MTVEQARRAVGLGERRGRLVRSRFGVRLICPCGWRVTTADRDGWEGRIEDALEQHEWDAHYIG